MTVIEKNLIIAALECSLANGKAAAGITTLTDIETTLAALRTAYTTDPATVFEKDLWTCYAKFQRLQFPNVENLWWAFLDAPVFDVDIELRTTWGDISNKPAKFPPSDHTHAAQPVTWEDVQSKPTTFPPSDHTHAAQPVTWEDVQSKPSTFPPADHTHTVSNVEWESVLNKPTTFAPSAHSHAYSDITGKPTTFAPSAHSHVVTTSVSYVGNGAASRVLTLSAAIMPTAILIMRNDAGLVYYWVPMFGSTLGSDTKLISNAISVAAGTVTLTSTSGNGNGNGFTLLAWGNAS